MRVVLFFLCRLDALYCKAKKTPVKSFESGSGLKKLVAAAIRRGALAAGQVTERNFCGRGGTGARAKGLFLVCKPTAKNKPEQSGPCPGFGSNNKIEVNHILAEKLVTSQSRRKRTGAAGGAPVSWRSGSPYSEALVFKESGVNGKCSLRRGRQ